MSNDAELAKMQAFAEKVASLGATPPLSPLRDAGRRSAAGMQRLARQRRESLVVSAKDSQDGSRVTARGRNADAYVRAAQQSARREMEQIAKGTLDEATRRLK